MSRLTQFAVSKRSVTILLAGALFIAGISAWGSLKQELLPDIEFPVITIVAPYPGAGAEDVADQVAKPIERAVSGVPRLESLQSTSANSVSLVVALFSFGTDVDGSRPRSPTTCANAGLPANVEPQVTALNINASPVIISSIAAKSEDGLDEVAQLTRTEIVPSIAAIEGVASADVTGGLEDQLLVTLDPAGDDRGRRLGPADPGRPPGEQPHAPVRSADRWRREDPGVDDGQHRHVEALEQLVVGCPRGRAAARSPARQPSPVPRRPAGLPPAPTPVTLGDIATVELAGVATTGYSRTNGEPSLTLTVTKTSAANTVSVARAVEDQLDAFAASTRTS